MSKVFVPTAETVKKCSWTIKHNKGPHEVVEFRYDGRVIHPLVEVVDNSTVVVDVSKGQFLNKDSAVVK